MPDVRREAEHESPEVDSDGEDVFYDARFPPEEETDLVNQSNEQKANANKLFVSERYSEAVSSYDRALAFVPNYLDYEVAVLRSNVAACHLKLQDWKAAVDAATASLERLHKTEPPATGKKAPNEDKGKGKANTDGDENGVIELDGESGDEDDETILVRLAAADTRRADINRIRAKSLLRRGRAKSELGGWANLQGAEEDYKELLALNALPAADEKVVRRALVELPPKIAQAREKEMGDMMGKLKDLGNGVLKPFGLSTDNFKFIKDEKTGGYNMSFER